MRRSRSFRERCSIRNFPESLRKTSPGARRSGTPAPADENSDAIRTSSRPSIRYVSRHSVRSTEWIHERSNAPPLTAKQRPLTSRQGPAPAAGAVDKKAASASAERISAPHGKSRLPRLRKTSTLLHPDVDVPRIAEDAAQILRRLGERLAVAVPGAYRAPGTLTGSCPNPRGLAHADVDFCGLPASLNHSERRKT